MKKYSLIAIAFLLLCMISLAVCMKEKQAGALDTAPSLEPPEPDKTGVVSTRQQEPAETVATSADSSTETFITAATEGTVEPMTTQTPMFEMLEDVIESVASDEQTDTTPIASNNQAHEHMPENILGVDATCISTGLSEGSRCSICAEILKEQALLPKVDHKFENGSCIWCGLPEDGSDGLTGITGNGIELPEDDA